jgi:predicted acetyltransferase
VLVELISAAHSRQPILTNLLQLYLHDFSEFVAIEPDHEGRFAYPQLPLYWSDPKRFPFLGVADGRWAGFVFVIQMPDSEGAGLIWDMAEFFVLRGLRRHGVGTALARLAFKRFPGPWQVRVMESNYPARRFWQQAIGAFTGSETKPSRTSVDGTAWDVFAFESKAG